MRADYDSAANAISIIVESETLATQSHEVHPRAVVAVADGHPVEIQILYPDLGVAEPLAAVASRYDLDLEVLSAAAQSALAAPDRVVSVDVSARSVA